MSIIKFGIADEKALLTGKYEFPNSECYYDITFCKDTKSIITHYLAVPFLIR